MFVMMIKNKLRMHAIKTLTSSTDLGIIKSLKIFNLLAQIIRVASVQLPQGLCFSCSICLPHSFIGMHKVSSLISFRFCANVPLSVMLSLTILFKIINVPFVHPTSHSATPSSLRQYSP